MNSDEINKYIEKCTSDLIRSGSSADLYNRIVNTPFLHRKDAIMLGLGIVVLLLKNTAENSIDRVALSRTEHADGAEAISVKKFKDIRIPLDAQDNVLVQVVLQDEYKFVTDWKYMFIPALSPEEARLNQAGAAIDCSVIYPLSGYTAGGCMIFSYFEPMSKLTNAHHKFMAAYSATCAQELTNQPQASRGISTN